MLVEACLERIKKIKNDKKITNDRLSEMTGIPLGTLSKLLAGINDSPKLTNMVAIAEALDCSLDYLVTGLPQNTHNYTLAEDEISLVESFRELDEYGKALTVSVMAHEKTRAARQTSERAMLIRDLAPNETRGREQGRRRASRAAVTPVAASVMPAFQVPATAEQPTVSPAARSHAPAQSEESRGVILTGLKERSLRKDIPLYDLPVSAGVGEFLSENNGVIISVPVGDRTQNAGYALRISGNSMEPKYKSGDVLLVEECVSVNPGELGIFILDGSGYFKQYGGDRLISLNPAYEPILLKDYNRVECCGKVVGKLKRK